MVGIGSSSSVRLGIGVYFVPLEQPAEHLVFGDAALDLLDPPRLLQRRVQLTRTGLPSLSLLRDPFVDVLLRRRQTFLLRNGVDHQIAPDLLLGDGAKFFRKFLL